MTVSAGTSHNNHFASGLDGINLVHQWPLLKVHLCRGGFVHGGKRLSGKRSLGPIQSIGIPAFSLVCPRCCCLEWGSILRQHFDHQGRPFRCSEEKENVSGANCVRLCNTFSHTNSTTTRMSRSICHPQSINFPFIIELPVLETRIAILSQTRSIETRTGRS